MKKTSDRVRETSATYAKRRPTLVTRGPLLSLILARDDDMVCAYCPELDIVTEMASEAEALADIISAMREYADEYVKNLAIYRKSPNRSHHYPYVQAIYKTSDDWQLRKLLDIRYGDIHLQ
jgi:hypothetical protein